MASDPSAARPPQPQPRLGPAPWVLCVDDGELEDVMEIARSLGASTARHRRAQQAAGWRQPQRLLVVSDRRAEGLGRPVAQEQPHFATLAILNGPSRALRTRIRKMGFDLSVERPAAHGLLRNVMRDALYRGADSTRGRRVPVGYPVSLRVGDRRRDAQLVELDARGCSLRLGAPVPGSRRVTLEVPGTLTRADRLRIEGSVVRECTLGGPAVLASLVFHVDAVGQARLGTLLSTLELGAPRFDVP